MRSLIVPIIAFAISGTAPGQARLHVDQNVLIPGDGTTWDSAFERLEEALDAAANAGGAVDEIWVAMGTYTPHPVNPQAVFLIPPGVFVAGGFMGGEDEFTDRDWKANPTILSGDLLGDDLPGFINRADNSHRVVRVNNGVGNVLDGFIVEGGYTPGGFDIQVCAGAGVFLQKGTPIIRRCLFRDNYAKCLGAGLLINKAEAKVIRCVFEDNYSDTRGGGASSVDSICHWVECEFRRNSSVNGGALSVVGEKFRAWDCVFDDNSSVSTGGALLVTKSAMQLARCRFVGNESRMSGAIHISSDTTRPLFLTDCEFTDNHATQDDYGAVNLGGLGPRTVRRCTFTANTADESVGALFIGGPQPHVIACDFVGNTAFYDGGAVFSGPEGVFVNCRFLGNTAIAGNGGGLFGGSVVTNSLFHGNSADGGGAIHLVNSMMIDHTTVAGNWTLSFSSGSIEVPLNSNVDIKNSVVWGNFGTSGSTLEDQIYGEVIFVHHSCVEAYDGSYGTDGNTDQPPFFYDPDGPDNVPGTLDDDLSPTFGSSLMDAGDALFLQPDITDVDEDGDTTELLEVDLLFSSRTVDDPNTPDTGDGTPTFLDMGAIEHPGCTWKRYCIARPGLNEQPASISVSGSVSISSNDLLLHGEGLPVGSIGYFLASRTQDFQPGLGGGIGILCVGSPAVHFSADLQIADAAGMVTFQPDLTAFPGVGPVAAGDHWNFQYWFRDRQPASTSNTSDAAWVYFCP